MDVAILCILFVAMYLWKRVRKLEKEIENSNNVYRNNLSELQNERDEALRQKHEAELKALLQESKVRTMQKSLDEAEKAIDFYKNITEASGDLNSSVDAKDGNQLIGIAVEQIKATRKNQKNSEFEASSLLDSEQLFACNEMESGKRNFFITGKAGTGKSFLLDVFRRTTHKSHVVLAPTGIAALNVNGVTLHSTFGYYNLVSLNVDMISADTIRLKSEKRLTLKSVSTIIIDEISMVRADTFDKIDRILKVINNNNEPFGGKQILLFGDLFQLPPVVKRNEYEYLYDKYGGIYFFCADAFRQGNFGFVELTINHRQKDDCAYFELLNRIRDGSVTSNDLELLNSRVSTDESIYDRFTTLLPTKAEVERVNRSHMDQLHSPMFTYRATVILDKYPSKNRNLEAIFPIAGNLQLKKGALVMMISNDIDHRWVNGTLGIVASLSENSISVAIDKRVYEIYPEKFTEQEITYVNGKITYEDVYQVAQYPLIPAYAITIHKSQGQTYKNIVCDIDQCFASGQAYVALSRCSSLSGMHLKRKVSSSSIHVDRTVLDFYHTQIKPREIQGGNDYP